MAPLALGCQQRLGFNGGLSAGAIWMDQRKLKNRLRGLSHTLSHNSHYREESAPAELVALELICYRT